MDASIDQRSLEQVLSSAIVVFPFRDAPEGLRSLSRNGGDEDWVAILPPGYSAAGGAFRPNWLEEGTPFGCCCVEEYALNNGRLVLIGSHA